MVRAKLLFCLGVLLTCCCVGGASAASGPWARADMVQARLISAVQGTGTLDRLPVGLEIRLAPGWKTYWRSPGDAGLPPRLDWSGSVNLASAALSFPAPQRFTLFGLETFGYEAAVVMPIAAAPRQPGQALELKAGLDLLVCSEICVPQHFNLALSLPAGPATPGVEAIELARAHASVPGDGAAAGLSIERVSALAGSRPGLKPGLEVVARARQPFIAPDVFVEAPGALAFGAPAVRFDEDGRRATLDLPVSGRGLAKGHELAGTKVTLTLVDGQRSAEFTVPVAPPAAGRTVPLLPLMLATALLGGLVLNLMPCVLPVLSLKLLSAIGLGGAEAGRVRAGFLASAAGIVTSFLVLAAGLAGLKAAGASIGWGIQFQQPVFLAVMALVVTLFAANLWGVFEIPLPRLVGELALGIGPAREPGAGHPGGSLAGHFATGVLATLLATPCSAPFLGTAVGFALARGPVQIVLVFVALGLGLALPYLVVALVPGLARLLPRPGHWMVTLRRLLGLALAGTGIWLLSVLAVQTAWTVATAIAGLLVVLVALLALRRRAAPAGGGRAGVILAGVAAAVAAVAAVALPVAWHGAGEPKASPGQWGRFDQARIGRAVAQGRTVFVDVTAQWCLTCQANKALVLDRGRVAQRLFGGAVVTLQADWTRPNAAIADYLAGFGRYGIPFDVVYGPAAPTGIALPELLNDQVVLDALARAGGSGAS